MSDKYAPLSSEQAALATLQRLSGSGYAPSPQSADRLAQADLVLVAGQFVAAGKSTLINLLQTDGRTNIPSWTNRALRPGETEGVDKCHRPLQQMASAAIAGRFLELEEVRPGCFYATPADFRRYEKHVKDVELRGALRLRTFAPFLPIIVPLPPLDAHHSLRVTEWERRVADREGYLQAVTKEDLANLENRLHGVVEETDRIADGSLLSDPNTLVVVNDDLDRVRKVVHLFLEHGEKPMDQDALGEHLTAIRTLATTALKAA